MFNEHKFNIIVFICYFFIFKYLSLISQLKIQYLCLFKKINNVCITLNNIIFEDYLFCKLH